MLERVKTPPCLGGYESLQASHGALTLRLGAKLADESDARRERLARGGSPPPSRPPVDDAAGRNPKGLVALARQRAKPTGELRGDDPLDRAPQGAILERGGAALRLEMEAGEPANQVALHRHRPIAVDAAQDRARALA